MEAVVTLLVMGALLLLLETVLPGMIAGLAGVGCLVAAIVIGYVKLGAHTGHLILLLVFFGLSVGTLLWMKYFPGSRLAKGLISRGQGGTVGADRPELLNQTGTALTLLRPSGMALINGQRVDVISEGMAIERGSTVKVIAVEGLRVVVRAM